MKLTLKDLDLTWSIIRQIAEKEGTTPDIIRKEMSAALEEAWSTPDPTTKAVQTHLFPTGKPTVESFILKLSNQLN